MHTDAQRRGTQLLLAAAAAGGRRLLRQVSKALAANLRHPDSVRILCGTLDELPRAFAALGRQELAGPPSLQCQNRDADLRRRKRACADDA